MNEPSKVAQSDKGEGKGVGNKTVRGEPLQHFILGRGRPRVGSIQRAGSWQGVITGKRVLDVFQLKEIKDFDLNWFEKRERAKGKGVTFQKKNSVSKAANRGVKNYRKTPQQKEGEERRKN